MDTPTYLLFGEKNNGKRQSQ